TSLLHTAYGAERDTIVQNRDAILPGETCGHRGRGGADHPHAHDQCLHDRCSSARGWGWSLRVTRLERSFTRLMGGKYSCMWAPPSPTMPLLAWQVMVMIANVYGV